jgi:hypothetical protein
VRQFASGQLGVGTTRFDDLYIGQAQLFALTLATTTEGLAASARLSATVLDVSGRVVTSLTARTGQAVSAPAIILVPGAYRVRYQIAAPTGSTGTMEFRVVGNRLSDPVGPVLDDQTLLPEYGLTSNPELFRYPGPYVTTDPFYWRELAI